MRCRVCNEDKLSKEFPRENVTEQCDHPPIHCYRCVIKVLNNKSSGVCPYTDCHKPVDDVKSVIERCELELEQLYPSIKPSHDVEQMQQFEVSGADKINVVMLTGDSATFNFSPAMSVETLRKQIEQRFQVAANKQQLMYRECVLEDYKDGKMMCLKDYNIQAFQTIHLMVLMYEIPSHFNHCIFDLYWGYPSRGPDFLDASCLLFAGKTFMNVVDYSRRSSGTAIHHSGDVMDNSRRIGHHTIEVHLKNIPSNITHLYFTLSAWNSPTISHFPNPSLKFFEASDKSKSLCNTSFSHARNSQAVIMCSVARIGSQWKIFECGRLSAGNANNYGPLQCTIQGLIPQSS